MLKVGVKYVIKKTGAINLDEPFIVLNVNKKGEHNHLTSSNDVHSSSNIGETSNNGQAINNSGIMSAVGFVKNGGLGSEFLKANGGSDPRIMSNLQAVQQHLLFHPHIL